MMLLGCDVRDSKWRPAPGEPSMCTECWPQGCSVNRTRTLALLDALETPPLVTTPDLLPGHPRAVWVPLPVDVAAWGGTASKAPAGGPLRVLHAPTASCHVAVDQLMAGVYGTFAAEMMAVGLPVIGRISPSLRGAYPDSLPVLTADEMSLAAVLEDCISGKIDLASVGRASRTYVSDYHCHHAVARRIGRLY
jgi:hypothetical protein